MYVEESARAAFEAKVVALAAGYMVGPGSDPAAKVRAVGGLSGRGPGAVARGIASAARTRLDATTQGHSPVHPASLVTFLRWGRWCPPCSETQ